MCSSNISNCIVQYINGFSFARIYFQSVWFTFPTVNFNQINGEPLNFHACLFYGKYVRHCRHSTKWTQRKVVGNAMHCTSVSMQKNCLVNSLCKLSKRSAFLRTVQEERKRIVIPNDKSRVNMPTLNLRRKQVSIYQLSFSSTQPNTKPSQNSKSYIQLSQK